ncbi:MAG: hypothetical protein OHK0039_43890 [Bacteroidia bacterium]
MKTSKTLGIALTLLLFIGCVQPEKSNLSTKTPHEGAVNLYASEIRATLAGLPHWDAVKTFRTLSLEEKQEVWIDKLRVILNNEVPSDRRYDLRTLLEFVESPDFADQERTHAFLKDWCDAYVQSFGLYEMLAIGITFENVPLNVFSGEPVMVWGYLNEVGASIPEPQNFIAGKTETLDAPGCHCNWGWWCATTCENLPCEDQSSGCGFLWMQRCLGRCDDPSPL